MKEDKTKPHVTYVPLWQHVPATHTFDNTTLQRVL